MRALQPSAFLLTLALIGSPAAADIRIGVAGPMEGPLAPLGAQLLAGVEAAVTVINQAGGLLGEPVILEVRDDSCDAAGGTAAATDLVAAGAVFVAGHLCSEASIAASAVYAAANVVQIAPGAPAPRFTEDRPGDGVFRLFGRSDGESAAIAAWIAARPAGDSVAIVDDLTPYGGAFARALRTAMNEAGLPPPIADSYSGTATLPDLAARIAAANVDVVVLAANPVAAGRIAAAIAAAAPGTAMIGGDGLVAEAFVQAAGSAADGVVFATMPDPPRSLAAAAGIAAIAAAGGEAEGVTLHAFAAVEVWATAVRAVGVADFVPVARAIATGTFETVLGRVSFTPAGDAGIAGWALYEWQGGRYRPLAP